MSKTPRTDAVATTCIDQEWWVSTPQVTADFARQLERELNAAKSLLWMAEKYAEAGGSNGPEMREYRAAMEIINGP